MRFSQVKIPPIVTFILRRLLLIPISILIITIALHAIIMLEPAESRAWLYFSETSRMNIPPETIQDILEKTIRERGLDDPLPVQYARWFSNLLQGDWGWSPTFGEVLPALLARIPATIELMLCSVLLLIPLGLIGGVIAGARHGRLSDSIIRLATFIATSIPPFILALMLLAVFYVSVRWFPPERLDVSERAFVYSSAFRSFTGLLTIDGLLNGRPDISLEALRHLVLPVFTLTLYQWAILARISRASMIEELGKPYITAARARGLTRRRTIWRHALRNAVTPSLTSSALSAASLVTGVFVVEIIFNFNGLSELITFSMSQIPDAPTILGFAVITVIMVLFLMLAMDILQAVMDPRIREGMYT
jgi:ABC-type dipeptide/oligopeptide/nickel transport system permease component